MGKLNLREWTMQEWTYRHDVERVDSAGVGNLRYVLRQWVNTSSIGPARLTVRDNAARTYNTVLESFHASLRRRMKVAHPNLYAFLGHLQRVTLDNQADITCLDRGLRIRRPKTKRSLVNDSRIKTCINHYDSGAYTPMQFLDAMSHNMGAHTAALNEHLRRDDDADDAAQTMDQTPPQDAAVTSEPAARAFDDCCEVCLISRKDR